MTSDYIILMAREAGIDFREHLKDFHSPWCDGIHMDEFKRFAKLIAEAEREDILEMCKEGLWDGEGIKFHLAKRGR